MAQKKYLLYIDILGFKELAQNDAKVKPLFSAIDNLNVHRHHSFKTIVFSDTILVFNDIDPISIHDHNYIVMYSIEFAQDLMLRCIDIEIQFRALLVYDTFSYERMKHLEAYYGQALINAYTKEKDIKGIGLFIDKKYLARITFSKWLNSIKTSIT